MMGQVSPGCHHASMSTLGSVIRMESLSAPFSFSVLRFPNALAHRACSMSCRCPLVRGFARL